MIRPLKIGALLSLLFTSYAVAGPLQYQLTDLGTLGGSTSTGTALNDNGFVVGSSITSGGATHAFEYSPITHSISDLGVLAGATSSIANSINNNGVIVGASGTNAFRWDPINHMVSMGTSVGTSINDSGVAVGYVVAGTNDRSARWDASNNRTLLFASTNSQAYTINSLGHLAGREGGSLGYYSDGSSTLSNTGLAGFLPDQINNNDLIVGADGVNAAMYNIGTAHETILGKLSVSDVTAEAFGVNNLGTLVGTSGAKGFVYDSTFGMQDLNTLLASQFNNWTIIGARGINNNGQILAEGVLNGVSHAVVLTVPEPSSLALAILGAIGMAGILATRRTRTRFEVQRSNLNRTIDHLIDSAGLTIQRLDRGEQKGTSLILGR